MTSERPEHRGWATAFSKLNGPWLGQTPPGIAPVEFAPEIFDTNKMSFGTVFSPAGDEFTRRVDNAWTEPETLPFNSDAMDADHCLSADGNRLYWRSWRPLPEETEPRGWAYLWWAERTQDGWSEAQLLRCGGRPPTIGVSRDRKERHAVLDLSWGGRRRQHLQIPVERGWVRPA